MFTYSSRIVSLADNKKYSVYTSPICLAIAFYFAEKKSGTALAKKKIAVLATKLLIVSIGENEVLQSLQNKKVNDFEDGMEYYAAVNNKCDAIITEDVNDFYFSTTAVHKSKDFLEKYLMQQ